jgi:hypothetical protein
MRGGVSAAGSYALTAEFGDPNGLAGLRILVAELRLPYAPFALQIESGSTRLLATIPKYVRPAAPPRSIASPSNSATDISAPPVVVKVTIAGGSADKPPDAPALSAGGAGAAATEPAPVMGEAGCAGGSSWT